MNTKFLSSFERDLKKCLEDGRNISIAKRIRAVIEIVERANSISDLHAKGVDIKKLKGSESAYRIKIGRCRIGLFIEGNTATFVRIRWRKEFYDSFP